jgi:hypothetical protein
MNTKSIFSLSLLTLICLQGCNSGNSPAGDDMQNKIFQFAPTPITYDESLLDEREKTVIEKLCRASKIIDEIFLQQVYQRNTEIRDSLRLQTDAYSKLVYDYFTIMFGPFDRLDHNRPFFETTSKPLGANFYPADMSKEEFDIWLEQHPEDKLNFLSEFQVIRRDRDKLIAIPYSEFYREHLSAAARYLNEAAKFADNSSLKKYLQTRAAAFSTNDYYESDLAWMDLKDHKIEVVIGPYEVYEDELFNYKAAFESFVTIRDSAESARIERLTRYLRDMEQNLPYVQDLQSSPRGLESPMVVAQLVFSAGDAKAGVQTLAFNLPNDERVRQIRGSKKVMLKNMHEAKFNKLLYPIARIVVDSSQLAAVTFNAFFNHTLLHEISHGIGPGIITVGGKQTEVKKELKETYSRIEECKADILGLYNTRLMIDKGIYPPGMADQVYITFLAGVFRAVRFGIHEAHGGGTAVIYNYLLEAGGYEYDPHSQKVRVNLDIIDRAIKSLAAEILAIEASGNYHRANVLLKKYAVLSPSLASLTAGLSHLPVDIRPVFDVEKKISLNN